ncbi:hypothetical protein [Chlorobium sp.]|uniref:hypothetical protein n=1 Tax=Chlorobium sp. TaxID=1095 RepID=UPI003C6455AC
MGSSQDIKFKVRAENDSQAAFRAFLGDVSNSERALKSLAGEMNTVKQALNGVASVHFGKDIAADTKPAIGSINDLQASLKRVTAEMANMPVGSSKFNAYAAAATHFRSELAAAQGPIKAVEGGFSRVGKGLGSSSTLAMNLGRVIADMPYGVMGVANNVEQLASSWAVAKAETGSAKGALTALIGSLAGPSGLLMVGVPVVTALAVAFGDDLMKAINGGSAGIEGLKKQLEGIQQYQDFDLTIKIAGLEGIARLKAELDQLIAKKAYLEGSSAADARVKASTPSGLQRLVGGMVYGQYYTPGAEYYQSRKAQSAFYSNTARQIAAGKMSLGEGEDVRMLTTYLKMSEDSARKLLATNKVNLDIAVKQSEIGKQAGKDSEKAARVAGGGRGGTSSVDKAAREAQKAYEEHAVAVEKATEWYGKATETVEGQYEAQKKAVDITAMLVLLEQEHIITKAEEIRQLEFANLALKKFSLNAQNASPDMDKLIGALPDLFGDDIKNGVEGTVSGLQDLGYAMEQSGIKIKGWDSFVTAYEQYNEYQKLDGGEGAGGALFKSIGSAIQGIGQMVGGGVGNAISSTASLALAGFSVAGPIGAVIGGVAGLVSSIFGGGSNEKEAKANRDQIRQQIYDNMVQSALSGGTESLKILRASGYTYDKVKNYQDPGYKGIKRDTSERLFEDRGVGELQTLQTVLNVLDQAGKTINDFMRPGLINDLDSAQVLLEYTVAEVGSLSQATAAYWDSVISTVTGINADSVAELMLNSIALATNSDQAARIFAEGFEAQLVTSLKNMAVAQMVDEVVMSQLQPAMKTIVEGMISGDMTSADLSAFASQAQTLAATIAPVISELYNVFDSVSLNRYVYSGTPIEARAYGGPVTAGQSYIVGDRRQAEVFVPGSDGYIFPEVPGSGSGSVQVVMPATIKVQIGDREFNAYLDEQAVKRESRISVTGNRTARTVY